MRSKRRPVVASYATNVTMAQPRRWASASACSNNVRVRPRPRNDFSTHIDCRSRQPPKTTPARPRRNGAVRIAHEYGELLLFVHAGSCDRGLGDLRLKEGEVAGVGTRLDEHGEPVADLDGVRRQSTAPISCSINAISSK